MSGASIQLIPSPPSTKTEDSSVSTKATPPEEPSFVQQVHTNDDTPTPEDLFSQPPSREAANSPRQQASNTAPNPQARAGGGGGAAVGGASTPNAGGGGGSPVGAGGGNATTNANQWLSTYLGMVGSALTPTTGGTAVSGGSAVSPVSHPSNAALLAPLATSSPSATAHPTQTQPSHPEHPPHPQHPPRPHSTGGDPLYVLDANTGETLPANTTLNSFSTWGENLQAQVAGGSVVSYTWDTSQAPDLTNISGQTTADLQGTWASFTGAARTDTITVTETTSGSQLSQTMTYLVAGTDSPAYSSSRPTSSSTWPSVITPDQLTGQQATQPGGPYASLGLADGSVQTSFAMPSYNPNVAPLSLDYNSTTANAQPIFLAEYQLPIGQSVPATITAQLTLDGTAGSVVYYDTSSLNPGDWVQIALQGDATSLSTGRYAWSITVTNGSTPTTSSGNVDLVNQANSPFGAGWSLDNVEQLVSVSGGVMLVNPDGTSLFFAGSGGSFTHPAGDFSTLVQNPDGTYTRTLTDGTAINFNTSGQQTSSVDRDGNTTTFGYTSGLLTSITDMNGQATTLAYNGSGQLSTITDPANRTATLVYTGSQLTSITDPANDEWQYGYDGANDLTTLTDPNNNATTFAYNFAGRVATVTQADNTTEALTAEQMNGLAASGSGTSSNPATAVLRATGDQAQYTDANDQVWMTGLDWLGFGLDTADSDPLGNTSLIYRDANGLAYLSADQLGRRTRDFFDSQGNTTKEVAPDDTTQQYSYNSFGEVTQYTDQENNATTYGYNSTGDLTQLTDALNDITTYAYNSAGLLTSTTDPNSNTTTYAYDSLNRLTGTTNALSGVTTYAYDSASNQTGTTDARGFVSTFAFDNMGRTTGATLPDSASVFSTYTYTYDNVGNQTSVTDPLDHTTTSGYNAVNELTSVTDALLHQTTYGYDAAGNQTSMTDALAHVTTYGYDAANQLTSVTDAANEQTTYGYDAAGEQTSMTDPLGNQTLYAYDLRGAVVSIKQLNANGILLSWEIIDRAACECPSSITLDNAFSGSASGSMSGSISGGSQSGDTIEYATFRGPISSSSFDFSDYGSIDGTNNPGGFTGDMSGSVSGDTLSGTFSLNGYSGTVSGTISGDSVSGSFNGVNVSGSFSGTLTISSGSTSDDSIVYQRDALHRVTGVTDALNNTTTYGYDAVGNQTSITDPLGHTTSYAYNTMNRVTGVTDALNNTTTYGYDAAGNLASVRDPLNDPTYTYDAQGRMLTATDANGGVTTYTYDLAGNQTSITDPDNNTTTYGYDTANRLTSTTDPLGHATTYSYDAANQLTSMTDRDGRTTTFGYDQAGRETSETWVGGNYTATYAYNTNSELTSASDPFSSYTYAYDGLGNETSVSGGGVAGTPQVTLNYSYDSFGDRTSMSDSLGGSISYGYDANQRLTSLALSTSMTQDARVTFGYDAASRQTGITRTGAAGSDTIATSLSYDNADRLTNITHTDTSKSTTLANYTYGYDAASRLTSYQDINSSLTYGYDKTGQLTSASGTLNGSTYGVSYTYDANGNRTMPGYTTGTGNELTSDGVYNYTYDNEGNTLTQTEIATGTVTYYSWDYRNRLTEVQVKNSSGTVLNDEKFTYDVNNNRIGVLLNGVQQLYTVYDASNPYMDFNGSGTLTQRYLTDPRELSQFYGQVSASGATQWYLTDNINSIRQVVNTTGTSLDAITYDPYGNIVSQTNAANAPRIMYAGGEQNSILGIYRFNGRWYNPATGEWLSQDPLGFAAGDANLDRYVGNNPVQFEDPSGLERSAIQSMPSMLPPSSGYMPPRSPFGLPGVPPSPPDQFFPRLGLPPVRFPPYPEPPPLPFPGALPPGLFLPGITGHSQPSFPPNPRYVPGIAPSLLPPGAFILGCMPRISSEGGEEVGPGGKAGFVPGVDFELEWNFMIFPEFKWRQEWSPAPVPLYRPWGAPVGGPVHES